ncbi:MAG: hypothetical protein EA381_04195 [Planctomycetaceae bacterium]|nr:MAG: hypothetical protein EA381_04195 [Planctomycetaceae bacterium]
MPASPSPQHRPEEKHWHHELYAPVPILGPTTEGGPPVAIDPPSDDEIMRALERAQPVRGGVPFVREKQRNNVHIVKEKIVEYVDPPRFYSLIGPAQLHHAHYKCTIHRSADDKEVIKVIYVDHNHFHTIGDVEPDTPPSLEPIASTDADS